MHAHARLRTPAARIRLRLTLIGAAATLLVAVVAMSPSANAAATLDPIQVAQAQLSNCQLLAAKTRTGTAQHNRAVACVADQTAILKLLQPQVTPSTTPPVATTPPVTPSPTVPSTTPPATTPPPTPSPTPTPTPTPTGIGSFATGPAGGAGLPPGTALVPLQGRLQANSTYTGVSVPASALGNVSVSGLTLRNCVLAGETVFSGDNITIDHCTIRGGVSFSQNHQVVFNHNDITDWSDCIHITEDGQNGVPAGLADHFTVTGNWCHAPGLKAPDDCAAHADGVQLLGVDTAVFSGNVIDLGPWISCGSDPGDGPLNGAFQIENTQGPVLNVTVDDNLLDGGGIIFRAYAGTKLIAVTGNGFGNHEQFGPVTTLQATIGTWSGNYLVATGAVVPRG